MTLNTTCLYITTSRCQESLVEFKIGGIRTKTHGTEILLCVCTSQQQSVHRTSDMCVI